MSDAIRTDYLRGFQTAPNPASLLTSFIMIHYRDIKAQEKNTGTAGVFYYFFSSADASDVFLDAPDRYDSNQ